LAPSNRVVFVDGLVEDTVLADGLVVLLPEPIHVDAEGEVLRRREDAGVEPLLEEDGVRAKIDVLLPRDQLRHEPPDLRVHERLAARDGHDGGAALVDGLETLLDGEVLPEDLARILDLAAARTGEVAAEQRLEHEDERVLLAPTIPLREHVARDGPHLRDGYAHGL
jgi:hypothetical protein